MAVSPLTHAVPAATTIRRLHSHRDRLVSTLLKRIDAECQWYGQLSAENRSWVGLVAQASISAFIGWCERADAPAPSTAEIFAVAPSELTQVVSLQHTLQLVRTGVDVIEEDADALSAHGRAAELRDALLRYSREFAFAAAEVYARAAEMRGSWDARLEVLLVDGLLRGDQGSSIRSRASALGWSGQGQTLALTASIDHPPSGAGASELRRAVRRAAPDALLGVHSDRVVIVLGGQADLRGAVDGLLPVLGRRVVVGPAVPSIELASRSVRAAAAGLAAVEGWPEAPRPVQADDLLPERLAAGDPTARVTLIEAAYGPLVDASGDLVGTLAAYLGTGRSLEASARVLFVHPNTVRYRLRKITEACSWDPTDPREAYVLQTALTVGRLAGAGPSGGERPLDH
ncbi:MAG: helix-turn-helix domain-containing protein [Bifidobacteriaceae bacterium]|jgi:hypothetical protein|nr:helix-turn-helix domain-containing protein [Bifidobacteriaceae bacterium]